MSDPTLKSARVIAAEVLQRFDLKHAHAGPILERLLKQTEERQRATDLVFGTIRNLGAIDRVVEHFAGRPVARIDKMLRATIRVGVYELLYAPDTPVYSIVNEAVNGAGQTGGKKQIGFVNAVLRGIERHIVAREADPRESAAARTFVRSAESGCEFDADVLPDPTSNPVPYLSTCFSIPRCLVTKWVASYGADAAKQMCLGSNRRPSVTVRANTLRTSTAELLERFVDAGVRAEVVSPTLGSSDVNMLRLLSPQAIVQLPGFSEGLFTVQDLSASNAVRVLDPRPDWVILDLCAAPGTKTTQLAEMTRNAARVVATDIDGERLRKVQENVARLGCDNVTIVPYAKINYGQCEPFDAILLDVPCSNTGVLARRVEVRYRVSCESVKELTRTQFALLEKAAALLKAGGRICYSTCSVQDEENGELVSRFLETDTRFTLAREELILPSAEGFDHDGAYVAILQRQ